MLAYTIAAARESGIFEMVVVSTETPEIAEIARYYGAEIPFLRPSDMAADLSPDIDWVRHTLDRLAAEGRPYDCFALLRPTSPFRRPETIQRAWQQFLAADAVDSLRAVEPCSQHPGKMWLVEGDRMRPLLPSDQAGVPWHSRPYQALPLVHVQNASLEIAWCRTVRETGSISGTVIVPFCTQGYEGFDLNDARDWWYAEHLITTGAATLPPIAIQPWPGPRAGVV